MAKTIVSIAGASRTNPADANYPEGSAKNVSAPSAGDGTPFVADWLNQTFAWQQAVMVDASFAWNDVVDTAASSQIYDAMKAVLRDGDTNPNHVRVGFSQGVPNGNGVTSNIQITGNDGANSSIMVGRFSDDTSAPQLSFRKSRSTDPSVIGALSIGDFCGLISFTTDTIDPGDLVDISGQIRVDVEDVTGTGNRTKLKLRFGGNTPNAELTMDGDLISEVVGNLGSAADPWDAVYANDTTINPSDQTLKTTPLPIDDAVLDVLETLDPIVFQWLNAVEEKGETHARLHCGFIAQQVGQAFTDAGLDPTRYAFFCHDVYQIKESVMVPQLVEVEPSKPLLDEDGKPVLDNDGRLVMTEPVTQEVLGEERLAKFDENGNPVTAEKYSLRYVELLTAMLMVERRARRRIEDRVAALENV